MKKVGVLLVTILIVPFVAGIYGSLHDQLSITISPEYFTKFKYIQFHISETTFGSHRAAAAAIGFLATWWTGLFIGPILAMVGLIHKDHAMMKKAIVRSTILTLCVAAATGLAGLAYGYFHLAHTGVSWRLPENLIDKTNFIAVGSMHNFSYLGGLIGLIAGVIYQLVIKARSTPKHSENFRISP